MHDYLMGHLANDRQAELHRVAAESRLARSTRRRAHQIVPASPRGERGMRAQLRLLLRRAAI